MYPYFIRRNTFRNHFPQALTKKSHIVYTHPFSSSTSESRVNSVLSDYLSSVRFYLSQSSRLDLSEYLRCYLSQSSRLALSEYLRFYLSQLVNSSTYRQLGIMSEQRSTSFRSLSSVLSGRFKKVSKRQRGWGKPTVRAGDVKLPSKLNSGVA